jgi:Co/Zn/Cd efflux system component
VSDLHLWLIGPKIFAATISIVTRNPKPPEFYKGLLPEDARIVHAIVEVHQAGGASSS